MIDNNTLLTNNQKDITKDYFIVLPSRILHNKNLNLRSKVLYGEIYRLSSNGYCWASNQYLAKIMDASVKTIQNSLNELEKSKLIKREIEIENGSSKRRIYTRV